MAPQPPTQPTRPPAPAGWYPHPSKPGSQGYWDGAKWTEHLAPLAPAASVVGQPQQEESFGGLSVAGYILAIVIPFIGGLIGFVLLFKRPSSGVPILILSVISFFVWYSVLTGDSSSATYSGY